MVKLYLSEIEGSEDKRKFEQIYQHYRQRMYSVAYGVVHNSDDAEDAVQDAFEVILGKLDIIRDVYSDETWGYLFVVVRNKAIKIYNKNKNRKKSKSRSQIASCYTVHLSNSYVQRGFQDFQFDL